MCGTDKTIIEQTLSTSFMHIGMPPPSILGYLINTIRDVVPLSHDIV